ncbi:MAG: hypothetical protein ACFCVK_19615 [Acidimicrobiales bacterium]
MTTFDPANREHAEAVAGASTGHGWAPYQGTALQHVGSPDFAEINLTEVDVDAAVVAATENIARWHESIDHVSWAQHRFKVTVPEVDDRTASLAAALRQAAAVGSVFVADEGLEAAPEWRWPLRLGWVRGSVGEAVVDRLTDGTLPYWIATLVEMVELGGPTMPRIIDFLVVPPHPDPHPLLHTRGVRVNALIIVGQKRSSGSVGLVQARELAAHFDAAAILVPGLAEVDPLARWFARLVEEVSHKNPIDVAMGKSTDRGIVVGNSNAMVAPLEDVAVRMRERFRGEAFERYGPDSVRTWESAPPFEPAEMAPPAMIEMPRALAVDDSDLFSMEGSGATEVKEIRQANELGIDLLPEPNPQRFLQAALFRDGEAVEHALAAGSQHWIHLWIGSGTTGFLRAETPEGAPAPLDPNDLRPDTPADIVVWGDHVELQRQTVMIHPSLLSDLASFVFDVPRRAEDFTINVALVIDGRVIQSGVVRAPVTPSGGKQRRADPVPMRFVVGPELVELDALGAIGDVAAGAAPAPSTPADRLTMIEHPTGVAQMFQEQLNGLMIDKLADHFGPTLATLVGAQVDAKNAAWLRSKHGARTFAALANQGAAAFQALVPWALEDPERARAMIECPAIHLTMFDVAESRLMVELVYDCEPPDDDADWCDDFDTALTTGSCPSCPPWSPTSSRPLVVPVCPAGFWGIRKIIERTTTELDADGFPVVLQSKPRADTSRIDGLDRVLIGTSDRVDRSKIGNKKPTTVMLDRVKAVLGHNPAVVTDWVSWQQAVAAGAGAPQVLVLLTHTADGSLELGAAARLKQLHMKTDIVRQPFTRDPAGPIVLLLGCDTASTANTLSSFVATFQQRGAAVVVGTVGATLGRFAAPIAGELIASLADPASPATLGEAVLKVRRDTFAMGWVTGLLLNSFGAADYSLAR